MVPSISFKSTPLKIIFGISAQHVVVHKRS